MNVVSNTTIISNFFCNPPLGLRGRKGSVSPLNTLALIEGKPEVIRSPYLESGISHPLTSFYPKTPLGETSRRLLHG